jgi:DNA-binding CsgD family transcriptional regulator
MVFAVAAEPLLLERDDELRRLDAMLEQASAGSGAVVRVSGPAGIGKSELLAAVRRRASRQGLRSLNACGRELESEVAFAVIRQLLEPAVVSATPAERRQLLRGPARGGAAALGLASGAEPASELAAIHGLYWLYVNLAERGPMLLTVDDVQWLDGPSLSWLGYFGRRAADHPVLVVVSVRDGDPLSLTPAVQAVTNDPSVQPMELAPLSADSIAALVRWHLGARVSAEFCAACWELSQGNPLYVRELLATARTSAPAGDVAALRAAAPAAVGASVLARLTRTGPEAVALTQALAVLGSRHEVSQAAELAGLDVIAAELLADALSAAQILAPARPLDFFHPLIREAVYADIPLGTRRLMHRRAAAILDSAGAPDKMAAHLLATGPAGDAWVTGRLSAAAENAEKRGAPEVAISYLRRALTEPPPVAERPVILLRLGLAQWHCDLPTAIPDLDEALETANDPLTVVAAACALGDAYVNGDRADMTVAVFHRARERISSAYPQLALQLSSKFARLGLVDDRTARDAIRVTEELGARLGELSTPPVELLVAVAHVMIRRARSAEDAHEAESLIEQVLAGKPYPPPMTVCHLIIATLNALEAFGPLRQLCEDLMADARQRSAVQELIGVASFYSWALHRQGELADAEAHARWALEGATGIYVYGALAHLIEALIDRGALADAETELARRTAPLASHSILVVPLLMARGRLHAAQGRHSQALRDFLACGERCERLGVALGLHPWRSAAATAHSCLGNEDEAARLARAELALARAIGLPRALGVALRAAGLTEGSTPGLALLAEAVSVLERSQAPVELARAVTDYGAALRRAGQRSQARAQLERGLDLAHHLGARHIARQAREELIAAGAKPRRDAITGRDALTASELRVARLAADGMSNREIAQALFITSKTASVHLSRVYRKLDVTRRDQLAEALLAARDA